MKYQFTCHAMQWRDKVNGNTYHSCRIYRARDGKVITSPMTYGYGDAYRMSALIEMLNNRWIKGDYSHCPYLYERENGYPILWIVSQGTKNECISHGEL